MNNSFDPHNPRVRTARQKNLLYRTPVIFIGYVLFIILLSGGTTLLLFHYTVGWILIGFSSWPIIFVFWIKNALAYIPTRDTRNFTDLISEDLLILLRDNLTTNDLIRILSRTTGGAFIMVRYGLTRPLLEQLLPLLPAPESIYELSQEILAATNSKTINGAVLTVATIKSFPDSEKLLSQIKLETSDLYEGIEWYNHLYNAHDQHKSTHSGGIARDFAFGYTPTLQHFAINLSDSYHPKVRVQQAENAEIINKIIHTFTHSNRQNIALIGAYGTGRSTIVNSFAEMLINGDSTIPRTLRYHQIYSLDAHSLISATKNQSELEYLTIKILNETYSAKNIILCLDNAHLFFDDKPGSINISSLLTPVIEAGNIRMILILDDQKFLEISSKNPALANSLNKIIVHPSDRQETIRILMSTIPYLEHQTNSIYTYKSLTTAYRLSAQYIHDIEMPGKAKLLLETASNYAENGLVTEASVETAVEASYGVKVKVADSTEDRAKLLNLEQLIHERMLGQEQAISSVANALRRARAGIKNQNRPIGTFLFLGPTGVGKTELAKTISEVYFNGEDHIIRLDMNEFVSSSDVSRLIKDGASDSLSLTAQVIKQPFSVILLDEIEKAHPSVLTTLLQVLDEGILRDEKNREVSFRDSIIIATSNAGANFIREQINNHTPISTIKEKLTETLISTGEFKPEFLNRFDEICIFEPLTKESLTKILDLIIASTNKTLANQKISVELTPESKQILIERGYDPTMGARPMRRIVQKTVENIVANSILSDRKSVV